MLADDDEEFTVVFYCALCDKKLEDQKVKTYQQHMISEHMPSDMIQEQILIANGWEEHA